MSWSAITMAALLGAAGANTAPETEADTGADEAAAAAATNAPDAEVETDTGTTPAILAGPRPVVATARVDKAVATTGDVITYTVTVEHDTEYEVELPEPGADIAGLRIIDVGREDPEARGGKVIEERWYQLRADLVGTYILPPLHARYREKGNEDAEWQTLATSQIFLEVESVLPADGEVTDIRDIKPLIVADRGLPWWVFLIAGGLLLAALGVVVWLVRKQSAVVVPPPPPHEVAFAALDALRQTNFGDLQAVRDYYFKISEILRAYIEGTYALNATDLTTEEILPRLVDLDDLEAPQKADLRQFLEHTDRVKFAEHHPSSGEIEQAYEHALSFVEATAPPAAGGEP